MKTPKRYHKIPAERAHLDLEPDSWEADHLAQETRWKRKNRIAQLKRTIARLEAKLCALEFKCEDYRHYMSVVQYTLKRQLESMDKAYFSHANVLNKLIDLKKP